MEAVYNTGDCLNSGSGMAARKVRNTRSELRTSAPERFLDLYYPFHYGVGFTIEKALRGDQLTQIQTIILWIIHSEGEKEKRMRRKDVEQRVSAWFDVTNSGLSKAIRGMAQPGLALLEISEDPKSGREKRIELTTAGQNHIKKMVHRTESLIARIIENLSDEEIKAGLLFLRSVSDVIEDMSEEQDVS